MCSTNSDNSNSKLPRGRQRSGAKPGHKEVKRASVPKHGQHVKRDTQMTCSNHARTQKSHKPMIQVHAWPHSPGDLHKEI